MPLNVDSPHPLKPASPSNAYTPPEGINRGWNRYQDGDGIWIEPSEVLPAIWQVVAKCTPTRLRQVKRLQTDQLAVVGDEVGVAPIVSDDAD